MKYLIILMVCFLINPFQAEAAIARVQFKNSPACDFVTSCATTFDSTTTSGNFVAVMVSCYYSAGSCATENNVTVADNMGNTYTKAFFLGPASLGRQWVFYAENITGGASHTVTMTATGTGGQSYYIVTSIEYSGMLTSGSLDVVDGEFEAASDNSYTSTAQTTTQADELLLGVHHIHSTSITFTPTSPFSAVTTTSASGFHRHVVQEAIVSSTGSYESAGTISSAIANKSSSMATFKATGGGGGGGTATTPFIIWFE